MYLPFLLQVPRLLVWKCVIDLIKEPGKFLSHQSRYAILTNHPLIAGDAIAKMYCNFLRNQIKIKGYSLVK